MIACPRLASRFSWQPVYAVGLLGFVPLVAEASDDADDLLVMAVIGVLLGGIWVLTVYPLRPMSSVSRLTPLRPSDRRALLVVRVGLLPFHALGALLVASGFLLPPGVVLLVLTQRVWLDAGRLLRGDAVRPQFPTVLYCLAAVCVASGAGYGLGACVWLYRGQLLPAIGAALGGQVLVGLGYVMFRGARVARHLDRRQETSWS